MSRDNLLKTAYDALIKLDEDETIAATKECINAGIEPAEILKNLTNAMLDIGEQFDKRKLYLPHVVMASDIMAQANELIYEVLDSSKVKSTGKVIIGTVEGDIHELGKTIVAAMLKTSGFEVIDLGYDIPPKKFLEAGLAEKADLVACSALMSSTRPYLKDVVDLRNETDHKDDFKIMVGGGAVNQEYADQINADIYAEDAMDAVHKAENALCR